jgi:hypothetical protein
MKTTQICWNESSGWESAEPDVARQAGLVLVFADHPYFHDSRCYTQLKEMFPRAHIIGCTSAGNVLDTTISDRDMVATAVSFDQGYVKLAMVDMVEGTPVKSLCARMMDKLDHPDLRHVFVLSDGLRVNGSDLATGLNAVSKHQVTATGGLAGDGERFSETWVMADAPARQGRIAAVGFYGGLRLKADATRAGRNSVPSVW